MIHNDAKEKRSSKPEITEGPLINAAVVNKLQNDLKKKGKRGLNLLRIVPVKIQANGKELHTYAVLDSGAEGTLIEVEAATALGLVGPTQELVFGTFHGQDPAIRSQIVNFEVCSIDGSHKKALRALTP